MAIINTGFDAYPKVKCFLIKFAKSFDLVLKEKNENKIQKIWLVA